LIGGLAWQSPPPGFARCEKACGASVAMAAVMGMGMG